MKRAGGTCCNLLGSLAKDSEICIYKLWSNFRIMLLNVKTQCIPESTPISYLSSHWLIKFPLVDTGTQDFGGCFHVWISRRFNSPQSWLEKSARSLEWMWWTCARLHVPALESFRPRCTGEGSRYARRITQRNGVLLCIQQQQEENVLFLSISVILFV